MYDTIKLTQLPSDADDRLSSDQEYRNGYKIPLYFK